MKEVVIYVEGGGDTADQKAELRHGLDQLLRRSKDAARRKRLGWKLVPCGGRGATYDAFRNAIENSRRDALVILLVDSEESMASGAPPRPGETPAECSRRDALARVEHLRPRDGWALTSERAEQVHLMVQCMETWLCADPDGMARYYKRGFRTDRLPARRDIENESKQDIYRKIADATRDTQKGCYSEENHSKIRHAAGILKCISAEAVASKCPRFAMFEGWLMDRIDAAPETRG